MSRLNPPLMREWQPGDGLTCTYAKRAPVDLPCGKPTVTAVSTQSAGPRNGNRTVHRPLCEHHASGHLNGETPGKVVTEAKKVATERLIHQHWDEFQRYIADAVATLTADDGGQR